MDNIFVSATRGRVIKWCVFYARPLHTSLINYAAAFATTSSVYMTIIIRRPRSDHPQQTRAHMLSIMGRCWPDPQPVDIHFLIALELVACVAS